MPRGPLALFGHSVNMLRKHAPSGIGPAVQVIALYKLPSIIQRFAENTKCLWVEFLNIFDASLPRTQQSARGTQAAGKSVSNCSLWKIVVNRDLH